MSGSRYDFLEFAEASPVDVQLPDMPVADITADPGDAEVGRRVDGNGLPLAQVVDTDTRGYRAFLEMQQDTAYGLAAVVEEEVAYELHPVEVFGGRGIKAGQFNFPGGIAVDSQGILYVADSYNHRIQRITPDGGVAVIGGRGPARTQFLSPQAVAVDAYDSFYVVEQGNHRVQKYSADGVLYLCLDRAGYGPGELYRPTGIAVSQMGDIYVADTGNCRVQRFDQHGNFISIIGSGPGQGSLTTPQAITVDGSDNLYVLDTFGNRIVKFDPTGRFVSQYGGRIPVISNSYSTKAAFREPRAIATDPTGLIYVADSGENMADGLTSRGRLQVVDAKTGKQLISIDRIGRNLGCLFRPCGLAMTRPIPVEGGGERQRGDLYMADTMNHRILRFAWRRRI